VGALKAEVVAAAGKIVVQGGGVALWQQGDLALNTAEAFAARHTLRDAPLVRRCLAMFWEVTLRSVQTQKAIDGGGSALRFKGYRRLFLRIYKVLIEDFDREDAEQVVKEDWEADSKGGKALSEADLSDSLWELTDLWVMTAAG